MIEFKKALDLLGSISSFIARRRQEYGVTDFVALSPKVLTQEKDGAIIYSWSDFNPPNNKSGSVVTHIGLFDPPSQEHKVNMSALLRACLHVLPQNSLKVIWINNQKLKIVSCSVNKAKSLLAFTTLSKVDGKIEKEVYKAFLAEIQATDTRVFSLNLERPNFLKVQFLYPSHHEQSASRETHLLVFLHKESIGLYKIPLARVGEKGTVMSDQPRTEQIVRKFVWCQWDSVSQRLHFIYNYRINADTANSTKRQKLATIQFHQNAKHDNMLDIPLNFPFPLIKLSSRSHYADRPLNPGIPDVSLNACVLSLSNGTYCLCYQHMNFTPSKGSISPTLTTDEDSTINYYICMVHHTKTINGCVSGLPKSLIGSRRLSFHWIGDYLMVHLPGFFVHLLNVGIEFEPCHHILLHNHDGGYFPSATRSTSMMLTSSDHVHDTPQTSPSDTEDTKIDTRSHTVRFQLVDSISPSIERSLSQLSFQHQQFIDLPDSMSVISSRCRNVHSLSPCMGFTRELGGSLYDYRNGLVWKVGVSMESLVESFKLAYAQTRQAILHYVLIRTKDMYAVRKLFADICQDLTRSELAYSMAEYLVASTYSSMKRQLEKEVMRLLPFTATETLRGQFERNASGERLARLSYTSLESINITTKTAKERQAQHTVKEDMWDILRRRLRLRQLQHPVRFNLEVVNKKLSKLVADEERNRTKWETLMPIKKRPEDGFLGSVRVRSTRSTPLTTGEGLSGRQSRTDMILGPPPAFLQGAYGEESSRTKKVNLLTEELLTTYLSHHLKKDNKVKAQNVAREYVACQAQKTQQLCHLLWSLRRPEFSTFDDEVIPNLCDAGSDEEYDLFQLYERLFLILTELCFPIPSGFQTCLTVLGFRCLHFRLFLQYVDRGVLPLTGQFVTQLLADVPDDVKANYEIKYQIISRLPKNLAEACFRSWNQPMCNQYFAQQQVSERLSDGTAANQGRQDLAMRQKDRATTLIPDDASVSSLSSQTFAPLASFIRHLEGASKGPVQRPGRSMTVATAGEVDTVLLEEVGLQYTKQLSQYDMSTVNF